MTRVLRPTGKVLPEHGRAHNRAMVLQMLFHAGPQSRAELTRATGLTRVTVSDLVGALMKEGLVDELGLSAEGKVGKPATILGLRTDAYQIVAVDLTDEEHLHGAVLALSGEVVERRTVAVADLTGSRAVDALIDFCRDLMGLTEHPVLGIGIASPGVIGDGVVRQAPNRGWVDLPLAAILSEALGVPVHVANDANAAALGEFTYGGASGTGLLVLTVGEGVGAGIVLDGALVLGHRDAAGELGHVTAVDERDATGGSPIGPALPCACGRTGCLETILSVPALRRRTAGLSRDAADAALSAVGRRLAIVLAPVVSALNLSEVVLSGPPELLDGALCTAVRAGLEERTMPVTSDGLRLRVTTLGEDGALTGAAVLVLSGQLGVS